MKELNKETYTKYDFIVNKTMEELYKQVKVKEEIVIRYDKNSIENKFILELCFFWATMLNKSILLETDIFTFSNLKRKEKRKINFTVKKDTFSIFPNKIIQTVFDDLEESPDIIKDIYEAYYDVGRGIKKK